MKILVEFGMLFEKADWDRFVDEFPSLKPRRVDVNRLGQVAPWFAIEKDLWLEHAADFDRAPCLVRESGRPILTRETAVYTKGEINAARLLMVFYARSPVIRSHWDHPVQFDFARLSTKANPAPWCWQTSELVVPCGATAKVRNGVWQTSAGEWCMSDVALQKIGLESLRRAGLEVRATRCAGRANSPPPWQLMFRCILPPLATDSGGIYPVDAAGQIGDRPAFKWQFGEPLLAAMASDAVSSVLDTGVSFWSTYELFGYWPSSSDEGEVSPPRPYLVVTQEGRSLLESVCRKGAFLLFPVEEREAERASILQAE